MIDKSKRSSAVSNTVSLLRDSILEQEDGAYLGSEDQLISKFSVSRPTLRQAVRLLEHERLLTIKRGSGGGFYARRPQIEAVAHAAAIYLQIEKATPRHIFAASVPLLTEAAHLATFCKDEKLRSRLALLLTAGSDNSAKNSGTISPTTPDIEFAQIISQMCGNPVIKLFISIIYEFGASQWHGAVQALYNDHFPQLHEARNQLIQAILDGDSELAMLYSQRRSDFVFKLIDDMPDNFKPLNFESAY